MIKLHPDHKRVKCGEVIGRRRVLGVPFSLKTFKPSVPHGQYAVSCVVECQCGRIDVLRVLDLCKATTCPSCHPGAPPRHGLTDTEIHTRWCSMKSRCTNPNTKRWEDYGGRGISVCAEWMNSFEAFRDWALANGYRPGLQIDRRDNDGNYEPDNCRWVTRTVNARNTRTNNVVEAFGERKTMAEWSEDSRCVVPYSTLWNRIARGIAAESAITSPLRTKFLAVANSGGGK